MAAKLAQLQRLGVVGALLNDVFEQEASSMEYEDMKLLLEVGRACGPTRGGRVLPNLCMSRKNLDITLALPRLPD